MRGLLLLIGAMACSSSTPTTSAGTGLPMDQLAPTFARVQCKKLFECCNAEEQKEVFRSAPGTTEATCPALLEKQLELSKFTAAVQAGTMTYDGRSAERCVAEFSALSCAQMENAAPLSCQLVFKGTRPDGQACTGTEHNICASGFCAGTNGGSMAGTCQKEPTIGQACPEGRCASGTFCGSSNVCMAPQVNGAPCFGGSECQSGICDRATMQCSATTMSGSTCWPL
jgi:hypothetical protein